MARRGKGPKLSKGHSLAKGPSLEKGKRSDIDIDKGSGDPEQERFTGPTLTYEGDDVTVTASPLGSIEARVDLIENDNLEVELVVGIDVSPIDLGLDYDVETGELNASGGIGIPGDLLGISGGLTIDTDTGEIVSISAGVEFGGLSVELEQSLDGCRTTLTTTYFGIGISTRVDNCKDGDDSTPTPTPTPEPEPDWKETIEFDLVPGQKFAVIRRFGVSGHTSIVNDLLNRVCFYGSSLTFSITVNADEHGKSWQVENYKQENLEPYLRWVTVKSPYTRYKLEMYTDFAENTAHILWKGIGTFFVEQVRGQVALQGDNSLWSSAVPGPTWVSAEAIPLQVFVDDGSIYPPPPPTPPPTPPPSPPPPPPPPPRKNDMNNECCRALTSLVRKISNVTGLLDEPGYPLPIVAQDEEGNPITINTTNLLAFLALQSNSEVLKILKEIGHVTGRSEENQYPGSLPGSMLGEGGGDREINNINDFLLYLHDTNDERWGQWEIDIQVKNKEGEAQPIKLNNLAEANAEIYGLLLQLLVNSQSNQTFNVKNLIETGLVRKEVVQSKRDLKVLLDTLGFDYEETSENLNLTFSIQTNDKKIETEEELLEESEVAIPTRQFNDSTSLKEILGELKQAAAIIRAVHWRKMDPKKDMGKQVLEYLDLGLSIADKLPGLKDKFTAQQNGEEGGGDRWDAWLEKIESEWATELGRDDGDRSDRPRIREVGRDLSD